MKSTGKEKLPVLGFTPIFKSVLWGGRRIAEFKHMPGQGDTIGESWELSPMPGHESVVAGGEFAGQTLNELCTRFGAELLGTDVTARFGDSFPLLIKFIDSTKDLSIQVHPDDALAAERHQSLGKTEMWYSVAPAPGAYLYAGFDRKMTPETFVDAIKGGTIVSTLNRYDVKSGDVFYLPAGRVHSIGQGNFVLEIQEASDVTYRIYDYDRRDAHGNPRQLHIDESVNAVNYSDAGQDCSNVTVKGGEEKTLVDCPYFTTCLTGVSGETALRLPTGKSFTIVISTRGDLEVAASDGSVTPLPQGHTVLIPASMAGAALRGEGEAVTVTVGR